jgi:hypothetical protein
VNNKNKNIIIGNLNNKNYFIPKYIFSYDTLEISKKEKNMIVLSNPFKINEYIKYSIPNENDNNYLTLINEKNENLGKLLIIMKNNNESEKKKL